MVSRRLNISFQSQPVKKIFLFLVKRQNFTPLSISIQLNHFDTKT